MEKLFMDKNRRKQSMNSTITGIQNNSSFEFINHNEEIQPDDILSRRNLDKDVQVNPESLISVCSTSTI